MAAPTIALPRLHGPLGVVRLRQETPRALRQNNAILAKKSPHMTPEDWKSKPAKNHQKDKDARWTKKHDRSPS